jgi:SEC-C motif-containing protein
VKPSPCPCGSGRPYAACCGRCHAGEAAPDAEALMRSRYSAYALGLPDYLLATWAPQTRPGSLDSGEADHRRPTWLGLAVHSHRATGDDAAEVEFTARFRIGSGPAQRLRETSRFRRENGRWFYVDGDAT